MADTNELVAKPRDRAGKGAARAARRAGLVPGVIYGEGKPPALVTIDYRTLNRHYQTGQFTSSVYVLNIDGKNERVLPKDVQIDPVRDFPIHVDFLRIRADSEITVEVPVTFINEEDCPGLKAGGTLNIVRHDVEVTCPANAIPNEFVIDLIEAQMGDSIHISAVKMPAKVAPTITDRDFTIATIASPGGAQEAAADDEAGGDGDTEAKPAADKAEKAGD
ncbi:MAG: 50S ribosomal protein L25/general stress protein Ctc [Pseudomonadota bacterium]